MRCIRLPLFPFAAGSAITFVWICIADAVPKQKLAEPPGNFSVPSVFCQHGYLECFVATDWLPSVLEWSHGCSLPISFLEWELDQGVCCFSIVSIMATPETMSFGPSKCSDNVIFEKGRLQAWSSAKHNNTLPLERQKICTEVAIAVPLNRFGSDSLSGVTAEDSISS